VLNPFHGSSHHRHRLRHPHLLLLLSISLVTHNASNPGSEIFNNYGAKPNSELLLGYGFTLPANPDDTIVLKIGGARDTTTTTAAAAAAAAVAHARHEVGREAHGAAAVWGAIMDAVKAENEEDHEQEGVQRRQNGRSFWTVPTCYAR
jgi:hypothetical protein